MIVGRVIFNCCIKSIVRSVGQKQQSASQANGGFYFILLSRNDMFAIRLPKSGQFFRTENAVIDRAARYLKPYTLAVYIVICRFSGDPRECYPSQRCIAERLGISIRQVNREIKKLIRLNFIQIIKKNKIGKWLNYTYFREFPSNWRIPKDKTISPEPNDIQSYDHQTQSPTKNLSIIKISKELEEQSSLEEKFREVRAGMVINKGSFNRRLP